MIKSKRINQYAKCILTIFICLISGCSSKRAELSTKDLTAVRDAEIIAPQFVPPIIESFNLDNGIKVYFAPDDEVPLFNCSLIFPRGSLDRVASESASYAALDSMMRGGGVEGLSSDQFDLALQQLTASLSVSVGAEASTISFGGLLADFDSIANLANKVWEQPAFNDDRLSLWKLQMVESIERRKESPESIAGTSFSQLLYRGSLIANPISKDSVVNLKRSDLIQLRGKVFEPSGMVVLISGAFNKAKAKELLESFIGNRKIKISKKLTADIANTARDLSKLKIKPGIYFIQKPFQQSSVYIGMLGPKRFTPDYPAIDVFNGILGADGEFSSMLVQEVRSKLGLSYSIIGGVFRDEPIGRSFIGLQTKNESVAEALRSSLATVNLVGKNQIPPLLSHDVKTAISNSFIFGFDSVHSVAARKVFQELLGYPADFDETYLSKIQEVTPSEISRIANKYWDIKQAVIVVVGDKRARISLEEGISKRWLPNLPIKELTFDEQLQVH